MIRVPNAITKSNRLSVWKTLHIIPYEPFPPNFGTKFPKVGETVTSIKIGPPKSDPDYKTGPLSIK
ncbi:hypothetical protein HanIR_Chr04g0199821 [Helianthus annuus]|nr:hypothetical protein HanIR_Chr04g0199821 [Helianthus annuus]